MTTYSKTNWTETVPVNPTNLNKLETQYDNALAWVKSYGLGTNAKQITVDLNTINESGFYYAGTGHTNSPSGLNGHLLHQQVNNDYKLQYFIPYNENLVYTRINNAGVWTAWSKINGMVSGVNSNGRYIRFEEGTQICYSNVDLATEILTAEGYLRKSGDFTWTYPASFIEAPDFIPNVHSVGAAIIWAFSTSASSTSATYRAAAAQSYAIFTGKHRRFAIGRWK